MIMLSLKNTAVKNEKQKRSIHLKNKISKKKNFDVFI